MTELSFLIDLLLNHELQKNTKDLIAARIKEVEEQLNNVTRVTVPTIVPTFAGNTYLESMHDSVAQTPAAAKALQDRQRMIQDAIDRKAPPKNRDFR